MGSRTCPDCNLVNPPETGRSDCGFSFLEGEMRGSLLVSQPEGSRPKVPSSTVDGGGKAHEEMSVLR